MLLAEELALAAVKPGSGRHQLGVGDNLNACLAGLLVAELLVDGTIARGDRDDRVVVEPGRPAPTSPTLAAAAQVVAEKGPKIKAVLSAMSRGLQQRLGLPTWDAVMAGLADAGAVGPATGGLRPRREVLAPARRDEIVARLRAAAIGDEPLDTRTALLLSMTGPGNLLEAVAPGRAGRRHARHRIDHALDGTELEPVGKIVRRLIQEAAAAGASAATMGGVVASSG